MSILDKIRAWFGKSEGRAPSDSGREQEKTQVEYTVEAIKEESGVESLVTNNAKLSTDANLIYEIKSKLESYSQNKSNTIKTRYETRLDKASNKKTEYVRFLGGVSSNLKGIVEEAKSTIINEGPKLKDLEDYRTNLKQAREEEAQFKILHNLSENPKVPDPDWKWFLLIIPIVFIGVETYINGTFLGERALKVSTGYTLALAVSLINIVVGYLVGSFVIARMNLTKKFRRRSPLFIFIIISVLMLIFNGGFGHFRQATKDLQYNAATLKHFERQGYDTSQSYLKSLNGKSYVKDNKELYYDPEKGKVLTDQDKTALFLSRVQGGTLDRDYNRFAVGDFESWLLLLIGFIFYLFTVLDFYKFYGEYPGYLEKWEAMDKELKNIAKARKRLDKVRGEADKNLRSKVANLENKHTKARTWFDDRWDEIETVLHDFCNHAENLNITVQRAYEEESARFYRTAPDSIEKLSEIEIGRIKHDISTESKSEQGKLFHVSKRYFPFLRELWNKEETNFKDKEVAAEKFQKDGLLFTKELESFQKWMEEGNPVWKELSDFDLREERQRLKLL